MIPLDQDVFGKSSEGDNQGIPVDWIVAPGECGEIDDHSILWGRGGGQYASSWTEGW